jgi:hypothetical protein
MKSHDSNSDNDYRSRAAANDAQRDTGAEKAELVAPGPAAQRKHTDMIDTSPYVVSQRKRLDGLSGRALQKQDVPEDEELLQGKPAAQMQPEDEEELLQGKITDPFQSPEEEELRQAKFAVQRQPEEEEELQGKFAAQRQPLEEEEPLQGKFTAQRQNEENRTGMPDDIKARMERTLDADFSDVRVHPNSGQATEVGALAYTQGADVHFAPGQFKPESSAGQQLLGHELTHVVQQSMGRVQPTGEVAGLPVNDSPDLENEADEMAKKV